ncbi:MAG: DNA translocase FtsK [Muribaculaceae bacterium]|nr:DNA translocase FtsK [Muribaculaceae bacterium]
MEKIYKLPPSDLLNDYPTERNLVAFKEFINSNEFQNFRGDLPIILGKSLNDGKKIVDLSTLPHLLIGGATGQGLSLFIDCIISSLLFKKYPHELKFAFIDPRDVQFHQYEEISQFMLKIDQSIASATDSVKSSQILASIYNEIKFRTELLNNAKAKNINEYNRLLKDILPNPESDHRYLPRIVLIVYEFQLIADALGDIFYENIRKITSQNNTGIHLILATQQIHSRQLPCNLRDNFKARISFTVQLESDSIKILGRAGAENLNGRGEMLYKFNDNIERIKGAYIDFNDTLKICEHIKSMTWPSTSMV